MELTKATLAGAPIYAGPPVEKSIKWRVGGEHFEATVYVRQPSYHSAVQEMMQMANGDAVAARIASCICDRNGDPIFTASDITGIDEEGNPILQDDGTGNMVPRGAICRDLVIALLAAIGEVMGAGKTKPSPTKTNSGASSSSPELEGGQSLKQEPDSQSVKFTPGEPTEPSVAASTSACE